MTEMIDQENAAERTPEFMALLDEYYGLKAMALVPQAKTPAEAWAFIKFNNLMDRLQTIPMPEVMQ